MIKIIVMLTTLLLSIQHACGNEDTQKVESLSQININVITHLGDKVILSETQGITKIEYDVNVNKAHQIGHQTFNQVSFQLLLKQPISLTGAQRRIIYEALGFDSHSKKENNRVLIAPIIVDESGEQLIYTSKSFPHLKHGSHRWSKLMSSDFFVGEAGGATQDVFEAQGGDGNAWPNGQLTFAGFQVNVRKQEFGRRKGILYFGDVSIGGVKLPIQNPYAYADGFFKKKGTYRLAAEIRNNFQATPIRELDVKIHYDPKNISSRKQRIEFPLGPVDNYWINYQITDALGNVVDSNMMRYQINNSEDSSVTLYVDTNKAPVLGYLRINSEHKGRGVYQQGEELVVSIRAFAKDKKALKLEWKLTPWGYETVLDSGSQKVDFKNDVFSDLKIIPKTEKDRDAYKLYLTVRAEGRAVDSHIYCLGYKTDLKKSHDRRGVTTNRHEIKRHTYNRTTYTRPSRLKFKTESDEVNDFREYLKNSIQITRNVTYMVDLLDFEVLPGVFDLNLLDKIMDAAADFGSKVTVRIAHVDNPRAIPGGQYLWPKYSRQHNYDGSEIDAHHYGAYAVTDPRTTKLWLDSYKVLFARYHKHTAFQGYYIMQPGGEWTVIDKPWEGVIAGYSEASAFGFRDYMKTNMGLSLSQLNQRWKTTFKSWSEIQPPLPALKLGAKPDLRMQWVDFNRFKRALDTEIWMPKAVNSIRSYDSDRITICYGQPDKQTLLYGKLDYCHNGGNHYGNFLGQYVDAWENGKIGWITEPHHPHRWAAYGDPGQKGWVLDWSVWVMIAQAGGGGAHLHTYYYPNPTLELAAHYAGDYNYDGFEKYKPILEELVSLKLTEPPIEVAALQDEYTLFTKHRTTFGSRLDDLKRWFELLKNDGVGHDELLKLDIVKGKKYKLILPNILDEVMSAENIEAIHTLVSRGVKMIITANTGSYCPEYGDEPFQLLKKLGISAPKGPYVQKLKGIEAVAVTQSPLFDKGDNIPFFSLADLQADLQSDAVKKGFWNYPYRWIPQTDYFGHYPENKETNGTVLARFDDDGVAMSLHKVGKGEVIVFWGTPDMRNEKLKGMMDKATVWADAVSPRKGSSIPNIIEGHSDKLKRHYALLYHESAGTYSQKLITVPDGEWFLDDMVSGQRLGLYTGKELRENGLELTFVEGYSPLKAIRMLPKEQNKPRWVEKYRTINKKK